MSPDERVLQTVHQEDIMFEMSREAVQGGTANGEDKMALRRKCTMCGSNNWYVSISSSYGTNYLLLHKDGCGNMAMGKTKHALVSVVR